MGTVALIAGWVLIGLGALLFLLPLLNVVLLSLGYVAARLAECTFIAVGIVSYLAVVTLHHTSAGGTPARCSTTRERSLRFATGRSCSAPASLSASGTG